MSSIGIPGANINPVAYTDRELPSVPVVQAPRRPLVTDKRYPMWTEWRTDKNSVAPASEGEFWKLIKFESNGDATWVRFFADGVSTGVVDIRDQSNVDVTVDPVSGKIDIDSAIVANATNTTPFESIADAATHTLDLELQIATVVAATPGDSNDAGISCFNTAQFQIDATSGMVSLAGGIVNPPVLSVDVDDNTPPGADPTLADGTGMLKISGALVAAHSVPLETHARAANEFNIEVQRTALSTDAAKSANNAGVASFNSAQFQIDAATGFIALVGSNLALAPVLTLSGDGGAAISPTAAGNIDIAGASGITVAGAGNTITITGSGTGGGLTWREETTATATFVTDEGIFANRAGGVTLTLPAAPSVGDTFAAYQEGSGAVVVQAQGADIIRLGTTASSAGGTITSLNQGDCITIVAVDATRFRVVSSVGSWSLA